MTPFEHAIQNLEKVSKIIKIDENILAELKIPDRTILVSVPLKQKNGKIKIFEGYRVQYNNARGPYKGGLRFHPQTDLEEVKALGFLMTIKTAVLDLPYGGSKGGITCDPKELTPEEMEALTRKFTRRIAPIIGPEVDIPAPDVNTDPEIMRWVADEYSKFVGKDTPAVVTGKPLDAGGSEGRETATAKGAFFILNDLAAYLNLKPTQTRVAIQGFGNAGYYFCKFLHDAGYKVVAVSDSKGGIYLRDGLDPDAVLAHKVKNRSVVNFPGAQNISNEDLLLLECDLLVPAALEGVITEKNAHDLKTKAILEIANGPTTPDADKILADRKIVLVPDVLTNAGGVTVSYFEWKQNMTGEKWSEKKVFELLEPMMHDAFSAIRERAEKHQVDFRTGAWILAIERLSSAMAKRT